MIVHTYRPKKPNIKKVLKGLKQLSDLAAKTKPGNFAHVPGVGTMYVPRRKKVK